MIRIVVSRHSAFYSPLIGVIAGGFLKREGLTATYRVLQAGETSHGLITSGAADVIQSAVSSNWRPMEAGKKDLPAHFAQINCRDGFFVVRRGAAGAFSWSELTGGLILADHAPQPLAMLKYAARHNGVDWGQVRAVDAGSPEQMEAAFRGGEGEYVHLQGPAAQQLEAEGIGCVAVSVGASMPAVAFSSLTASGDFLASTAARAFLRAYGLARRWTREAPPAEIAAAEAPFFPGVSLPALQSAIAAYQQLGCWAGDLGIPRDLYEQALNVFIDCGAITVRWRYEDVVAEP
jgi:NitT/TauT family transport system substrate-binding protein